jgi:hypothetical protein
MDKGGFRNGKKWKIMNNYTMMQYMK